MWVTEHRLYGRACCLPIMKDVSLASELIDRSSVYMQCVAKIVSSFLPEQHYSKLYASAGIAVIGMSVCVSARLSVRLSHTHSLVLYQIGLCYPSNLLLEYSASTLASTRVLA